MAEPNTGEWYLEIQTILMQRIDMLNTVTLIHLAIKHPLVTEGIRRSGKKIARALMDGLRADGIEIPQEVWESYKKDIYQE